MLASNTVLQGRYTIVRKLGQGGMGAVYLARDGRFQGRVVALKQTLVDRNRADLRRQFEREALLLFDLKHQALPKVIDYFGEADGEFLVMEYVEGLDLAELMEQNGRPFGVRQVLAWSDQLLDALAYLHAQDPPVVHRDIKPNNVKLTPKGQVVLLDFGLAKGSLQPQAATISASITAGTPAFAPLEQMRGQGTDERSDLYGLAATMYVLLSGRMPADSVHRAAELINGRPDPLVPLPIVAPECPDGVWRVLERALSLPKDARQRSAAEMHDALRAAWAEAFGRGTPAAGPTAGGTPAAATPTAGVPPPTSPYGAAATQHPQARATAPEPGQPTGDPARPTAVAAPPQTAMPSLPAPEPSGPVATDREEEGRDEAAPGVPTGALLVVAGLIVGLGAVATYLLASPGPSPAPPREAAPAAPVAKPAPKPAPAPAYVEAVRWRLEREDGTPLAASAGAVATGEQFRFRFSSATEGFVFLLAPDATGVYRAYLTSRPSPATNVRSNEVGPGREVVFPGAPLTLSVQEGETRFLVVVAPSADIVPAVLRGEVQTPVPAADLEALRESAGAAAGEIRTEALPDGGTVVRREEGDEGSLVFEIVVTGLEAARR